MRRTLFAALALAPLAMLAPHATAKPPLPCDYWTHGCDVLAYVCDNPNFTCNLK